MTLSIRHPQCLEIYFASIWHVSANDTSRHEIWFSLFQQHLCVYSDYSDLLMFSRHYDPFTFAWWRLVIFCVTLASLAILYGIHISVNGWQFLNNIWTHSLSLQFLTAFGLRQVMRSLAAAAKSALSPQEVLANMQFGAELFKGTRSIRSITFVVIQADLR